MIILNYNDYFTTQKYLELIKNFHSVEKIVVVDNHSDDDSYIKLMHYANEKIHIICTDSNRGYAYGNNYGVNYVLEHFADIENLIISNPDIEVSDSTISSLAQIINNRNDAFAITPLVLNMDRILTRNFAWKKIKYGNVLASCTTVFQGFLRIVCGYTKFYKKPMPDSNDLMAVDILPGCFFVVNAKKWITVCGFDENTFLYFEEDIIFSKALSSGYHNYVLCKESLIHMESVSVNKSITKFSMKERIYRDSCIYYLQEYMKVGKTKIFLYKALNILLIPDRYLFTRFKNHFNH